MFRLLHAAFLLSVALLIATASSAVAQWTTECSSPNYQWNEKYNQISLHPDGSLIGYVRLDSSSFGVYTRATPCAPYVLLYQHAYTPSERSADFREVFSCNQDLTGDGIAEVYVESGYYPSRSTLEILNLTNNVVLYASPTDAANSYGIGEYGIYDADLDGTLEFQMQVEEVASGTYHYELLNTGVAASGVNSPAEKGIPAFKLKQNFPNPFNPSTRIEYSITHPGHVALDVYNVIGQKVTTLVNTRQSTGQHTALWNGQSTDGRALPSGPYYYQLRLDGVSCGTRQMLMIK